MVSRTLPRMMASRLLVAVALFLSLTVVYYMYSYVQENHLLHYELSDIAMKLRRALKFESKYKMSRSNEELYARSNRELKIGLARQEKDVAQLHSGLEKEKSKLDEAYMFYTDIKQLFSVPDNVDNSIGKHVHSETVKTHIKTVIGQWKADQEKHDVLKSKFELLTNTHSKLKDEHQLLQINYTKLSNLHKEQEDAHQSLQKSNLRLQQTNVNNFNHWSALKKSHVHLATDLKNLTKLYTRQLDINRNLEDDSKKTLPIETVFTREPHAAREPHVTREPAHVVTGKAPNVTKERTVVTKKPVPVTEKLTPVAEKPAPVAEKPAPVSERPAPVSERPTPVTERPTPVSERPTPVSERPAPVSERPTPVSERPAVVTERPAVVTEKLADIVDRSQGNNNTSKATVSFESMSKTTVLTNITDAQNVPSTNIKVDNKHTTVDSMDTKISPERTSAHKKGTGKRKKKKKKKSLHIKASHKLNSSNKPVGTIVSTHRPTVSVKQLGTTLAATATPAAALSTESVKAVTESAEGDFDQEEKNEPEHIADQLDENGLSLKATAD